MKAGNYLMLFLIFFLINFFLSQRVYSINNLTNENVEISSGQILKKITQAVVNSIDNHKVLLALMVTNFFPMPRVKMIHTVSNTYGVYAVFNEICKQLKYKIEQNDNNDSEKVFEKLSLVKFGVLWTVESMFFFPLSVQLHYLGMF